MSPSDTSCHASVSRAGKTHIPLDPTGPGPHNPPIPKLSCGMGRERMRRDDKDGMGRDGRDRRNGK